jgi:2-methylisocitrate lyase-like PEP mutase family enzyme
MSAASRQLRTLLTRGRVLQVPGVYDGLTARLAAEAGFEAISITGNALAASLLGVPDIGLTTLTEVVTAARNMWSTSREPSVNSSVPG